MSKALSIFRRHPKPDAIIGQFPAFHLEYHRNHVVGSNLQHIMYGGSMNMRLLPIKERWQARDTNALWWWVGSLNHFQRECVKRHQMRRIRNAFKSALGTLGYDEQGNSIAASLHEARKCPPLRGSLQLRVKKEAINAKFVDIEVDMVKGVQRVLQTAKRLEGRQADGPLASAVRKGAAKTDHTHKNFASPP
jgi:hypothetical protein